MISHANQSGFTLCCGVRDLRTNEVHLQGMVRLDTLNDWIWAQGMYAQHLGTPDPRLNPYLLEAFLLSRIVLNIGSIVFNQLASREQVDLVQSLDCLDLDQIVDAWEALRAKVRLQNPQTAQTSVMRNGLGSNS